MRNMTSLTRKQIGALDLIRATVTPDDWGTVCAIGASDDMIEVELKDDIMGYSRGRYTRYIDSEGAFWRHDPETDQMVRASVTPERGSYKSHHYGNTVHYVY
jgi:hypothetical protein